MKNLDEMVKSNNVPSLFDKHPRDAVEPMTIEFSKIFLQFTMDEVKNGAKPIPPGELEAEIMTGITTKELPFPVAVMVKRLVYHASDLTFNPNVVLLLALAAPNVASVVMWGYSLVRETRKRQGQPINVMDLGELLPWGFPKEDHYERTWRSQKFSIGEGRSPGNFLDTAYPWQPILNGIYEPSMTPG